MQRRTNFLTVSLISIALLLGLSAGSPGTAYAQCDGGKVLVQKTNKQGKVHFICVSPNAVKGLIKSNSLGGVWGIHLMEMDLLSDGSIDRIAYYESNDDGRTVAVENDGPPIDGMLDYGTYFEYDADGNRILQEEDTDYDGVLDNVVYSAYNDAGKLTWREYDDGYDGIIESDYSLEYDDQNRVIEIIHTNYVIPAYDYIEVRTYYPGNQTLLERDDLGDGSVDSVERWYEYFNPDGQLVRREVDYLDDTTIDRIYYWTWDPGASADNWVRYDTDTDNDGIIDRTFFQEFDLFGHIARTERIIPADPTNNYIQYYTWVLK